MVIKLQADLYDDARIRVNILGCLESHLKYDCALRISARKKKDFISCDLVDDVN